MIIELLIYVTLVFIVFVVPCLVVVSLIERQDRNRRERIKQYRKSILTARAKLNRQATFAECIMDGLEK